MDLREKQALMREARAKGQAVPAYDTTNYTYMKWLAQAAREFSSPVIFMYLPNFKEFISFREFVAFKRILEEQYDIPMMTHLDHSRSQEEIEEAIKEGFDSVMIDASAQPFNENVEITRRVVDYAHEREILVEAELGKVGSGSNKADYQNSALYTVPEEAAEFAAKTQVDMLAVAIGNSHGVYAETPKLDIDRLKELSKAVALPLVLHGTSLIPEDQVGQAIANGICKVNLCTELYISAMYAVEKAVQEGRTQTDRLIFEERAVKPDVLNYFHRKLEILRNSKKEA